MLEIKNITKKYAHNLILDDISFQIPDKKLVAIIGSNGSGKSTLLSIMSRILKQNSGEVLLHQKSLNLWNENDLAKQISFLQQSNALHVKLSVNELVSFGRFPHSQGKLKNEDKQMIQNALEYANIRHLRHRYLDELSGGQRQMAYIAMIIAQNTPYIFLDEPLNNLDMKHSRQIMKILKELTITQNKTIVVVIHDINFVSVYADFIIALKDQKIAFFGDKNDGIDDKILNNIFDMDMQVKEVENKKVCIYY